MSARHFNNQRAIKWFIKTHSEMEKKELSCQDLNNLNIVCTTVEY